MPPSVIVTGFLADAIGLGEAARGYALGLAAAGCDVALHPIAVLGRAPSPAPLPDLPVVDDRASADVVVHCFNPPELVAFREERRRLPTGRRTVGVWAWEVDPVPDGWAAESRGFDELWTYTEPVARRLRAAGVEPPVATVPPALDVAALVPRPATETPTVVAVADAWSSLSRKNPRGAVDAFRTAVPPGEGTRLVVKIRSGDADPQRVGELRDACADRDDIDVVDRLLPRDELLDLVGGAACLVSLHRAEGLGLPLFEALALGVPVVCTAGGGPGELLEGTAAHLVDAAPATIGEGVLHYPPDGEWLEPDVGHAATLLRRVLDDPDAARRATLAARPALLRLVSPPAAGATMRRRIEALVGPKVSVVLHATDPWPAVRPIVEAAGDAWAATEVVIGAPNDDVVPAGEPLVGVNVVRAASTSPFDLRAAALGAAVGDLVVVTEDHCVPAPQWIDAYVEAYRRTSPAVLAGPVDNGSTARLPDWSNYLIGFAAWGSPIEAPPEHFGPTIANVAFARAALPGDVATVPSRLERDVLPRLWSASPYVVPGAAVRHVQRYPLWRHALHQFEDCRTAGDHERRAGRRRSLRPRAIAAEARRWLALASQSVGPRPHLHDVHRRAAWHLRVLALARALGLTLGNRCGAGRAASRLD